MTFFFTCHLLKLTLITVALPDSGSLFNDQTAEVMLRFTYMTSHEVMSKITDVNKAINWINTTGIDTGISRLDDMKLVVKVRLLFEERDDPICISSTA